MQQTRCEIILSGVGGQGLISSGKILGEAATRYENKFVTMTSSYGVSARGGFSRADVIIDDSFVSYFKALAPDVILVLDSKAYPEIRDKINNNTLVIINQDEVEDFDPDLGQVFPLSLSRLAYELGSLKTLNIISLGFIAAITDIVSRKGLTRIVKEKYPGNIKTNLRAIEKGYELKQL